MDYSDILKRAWGVVWRHKVLWVFGLFAVGGSGYSGGGGSGGGGGDVGRFTERTGGGADWNAFIRFLEQNLSLLIVLGALLILVWLGLFVLSFAATGGLVHLVREADEGRPVRFGDGWSFGFRYWGRTFLILLLFALPFLIIAFFLAALVAVALIGATAGGGAVSAAPFAGLCVLIPLFVIVMIVLAVLVGLLMPVSLRHGLLTGQRATDAIRAGWRDLRGSFKDIGLMWLILVAIGIGFGFGLAFVVVVLALPSIFLFIAEEWVLGAVLLIPPVLAAVLISAIYKAFESAVWTIFFRRLQAKKVPARTPVGAQSPGAPPPSTGPPPSPPSPGAPPPSTGPPLPPLPEPPAPL